MADHDPGAYGRYTAADYDELTALHVADTAEVVETLATLASGGPILEFGIGTGRLALPLAQRGFEVAGIEASEEMLAQLRAKPDGETVVVAVGDFTSTRLGGGYPLVVLAYNTVYALPDQDAQVACFANAAAHLRPGGRFVIDAWLPDVASFTGRQAVRVLAVREDVVLLEAAVLDPVRQRMTTTKVRLREGGADLFPANHRYAWPAELDLMARMAGLDLQHRWGGWARTPFTADSTHHVSVYLRRQ